jgi:hypothetical protein
MLVQQSHFYSPVAVVRWNTGILVDPYGNLRGCIILLHCGVYGMYSLPRNKSLDLMSRQIFRHRVRSVMSKSTLSTLSQPPLPKPPILLYRKMILRIGRLFPDYLQSIR